jgi:RNA polymerase sigma-70 factor (ECF subfamily)
MIKNLDIADNELLALFKDGDQVAFKMIYERYWQVLYVAACKVIKDEEEAKDVVQEVFISLLNKRSELRVHSTLSSYLYSAVRYKVFDQISRQKVRSAYADSFSEFASQSEYSTDRALLEKEIHAEMEKEIQNLPGKMKEVFELSRKEELSHKEIAETLNISDKTVKKQISNAIKLLKPKFTNFYLFLYVLVSAALSVFFKLF